MEDKEQHSQQWVKVRAERQAQLPWCALACAISPGGELAVVGGRGGAACVVPVSSVPLSKASGEQDEEELDVPMRDTRLPEVPASKCVLMAPQHVDDVRDIMFFPSGLVVASCGADMSVQIWSAVSGRCAARLSGHTRTVLAVRALGRGRRVATASADGTVRLWLLETQKQLACWRCAPPEHTDDVAPEAIAVLGAGDTPESDSPRAAVVAACWDGQARLFDLRAPHEAAPAAQWDVFGSSSSGGHLTAVCSVPTGECDEQHLLAFGSADGRVGLCDVRQLARPLAAPAEGATGAEVSRLVAQQTGGGAVVVAANAEGTAWATDPAGTKHWRLCNHNGAPITGLDIAQNGSTVLTCTRDGTLLVHNLEAH